MPPRFLENPFVAPGKLEKMVDITAPEPVHRLPVIPHAEKVAMFPQKKTGQLLLEVIGILVLIHQDMGEKLFILLPHLGKIPQNIPCL